MTSAMKEIMFAVSRTVSPCAICDFSSSRSASPRPSAFAAEAKLKRVRVELSRKMEIASPVSKMRKDLPAVMHLGKQFRERDHGAKFILGFFPRQQEILAIAVEFELFQFGQLFLERVHFQKNQAIADSAGLCVFVSRW